MALLQMEKHTYFSRETTLLQVKKVQMPPIITSPMNDWFLFILLFVSQNSNEGVQKERNSKQHSSCGFGEGNGTPLQYSCLENPMDGGAWWAAVHGVAKSDTTEQLHFHFSLSCIGEGNGNPLQCSCLEDPRDGGAWWAVVYGVTQSRTQLK